MSCCFHFLSSPYFALSIPMTVSNSASDKYHSLESPLTPAGNWPLSSAYGKTLSLGLRKPSNGSFSASAFLSSSAASNSFILPWIYNTPIQEHSIFDFDSDNGLDLSILVSITFPENFMVLNEVDQKAYWVWNSKKYGKYERYLFCVFF